MPHRIHLLDTILIAALGTSFFSNLIDAIGEVNISFWFTTGSFLLALIVSFYKIKTFRYDLKIKKLQYKNMIEEDEKND